MDNPRDIVEQYAHTSLAASAKAMCLFTKVSPYGGKLMFVSQDNFIVGAGAGTTRDAFLGAACNRTALKGADILANITLTTGAYRALTGVPGSRYFKKMGSINIPSRVPEVAAMAMADDIPITFNPDLAKTECFTLPADVVVPRLNKLAEAGRPLTKLQQSSGYLAWAILSSSPGCTSVIVNQGKLIGYSYEKDCQTAAIQAIEVANDNKNYLGRSVAWTRGLTLDILQILAEAGLAVVIAPSTSKSCGLAEVATERRIKLYLV